MILLMARVAHPKQAKEQERTELEALRERAEREKERAVIHAQRQEREKKEARRASAAGESAVASATKVASRFDFLALSRGSRQTLACDLYCFCRWTGSGGLSINVPTASMVVSREPAGH